MYQNFKGGTARLQTDLGFISLRNLLFSSCRSIMVRFSIATQ